MTWWPFKKRRKGGAAGGLDGDDQRAAAVSSPPPQLPPLNAGNRSHTAPVEGSDELFKESTFERAETPQTDGADAQSPELKPPRSAPHDAPKSSRGSPSVRRVASAKGSKPELTGKGKENDDEITALPVAPPKTPKSRPQSPMLASVQEPNAPTATLASTIRSEVSSIRRVNTKKQKEDRKQREAHIKAISKPIDIPRKAETWGVFRSPSQKTKGSRPAPSSPSASSFPRASSTMSSIGGASEQQFQLGSVGLFTPRPTIRYSIHAQVTSSGQLRSTTTTRGGPARPFSARPSEDGFTIDELGDDYDSATLRTLMDKDKLRREKKQIEQEERARRRLERLSAKQEGRPVAEKESRGRRSKPERKAKTSKDSNASETTEAGPSKLPRQRKSPPPVPHSTDDLLPDPYGGSPIIRGSQRSLGTEQGPGSPYAEEDAVIETAQAVRYASATMSQPSSPLIVRPTSSEAQTTPEKGPELPQKNPRRASVSKPKTPEQSPISAKGQKKGGLFGSIFGKKREPKAPVPAPVPESKALNDSTESVGRKTPTQPQAEEDVGRVSTTSSARRPSRFRENLPEQEFADVPPMPTTLPEPSAPIPISSKVEGKKPEQIQTRSSTDAPLSRHGSTTSSAAPASAVPLSQSLASVDSEGSWLSGRARNRSSQQTSPPVGDGEEAEKDEEELEASQDPQERENEELEKQRAPGEILAGPVEGDEEDKNEQEAEKRTEPEIEGKRRESEPTQAGQQEDNDADSDTYDGELVNVYEAEITRGEVARKATLVSHPGPAQSSEGLLNQFEVDTLDPAAVLAAGAADIEVTPPSSPIQQPQSRKESYDSNHGTEPDDEDSPTGAGAAEGEGAASAISVGITHVRSISGGSARILEIPKRNSLREVRSREAREKAAEMAERDNQEVD